MTGNKRCHNYVQLYFIYTVVCKKNDNFYCGRSSLCNFSNFNRTYINKYVNESPMIKLLFSSETSLIF